MRPSIIAMRGTCPPDGQVAQKHCCCCCCKALRAHVVVPLLLPREFLLDMAGTGDGNCHTRCSKRAEPMVQILQLEPNCSRMCARAVKTARVRNTL